MMNCPAQFMRIAPLPSIGPRTGVRLLFSLLILVFAFPERAISANPIDTQSASPPTEVSQTASVMLDGQVLFAVRGVTAFPAEQRASAIRDRLEAVAANRALTVDALLVEERPDSSLVKLSGVPLVTIYDEDAVIEGVSRSRLAETYRLRIQRAIVSYRHDRSSDVLVWHSLYALAIIVAVVLTTYVLLLLFRRLDRLIEDRYRARVERRVKVLHVVDVGRLWEAIRSIERTVRTLMLAVLWFLSSQFVLSLYPWTRPLSLQFFSLVLDPLRTMGAAFIEAVPSLMFLAILVIIVRYLLRLLNFYFLGIQSGTIRLEEFDPEWALPTYRLIRLLVIALALVLAYPHVPGSQSEAFKGVSILLGVIFSLGSSSTVANMIAGYTMIYRRVFKVGDRIMINDMIGDVTEMRLQVTHLRSLNNEEISVPNSTILTSSVTNFSRFAREGGVMLHTTVGIGYETPWRQVEAMLLEAANRTSGLLRDPPPFVLVRSLGDFAVEYELKVCCQQPLEMMTIYSVLHRNILDLFNEHGVQIMTPAYEGDPETPKVVPKNQWFLPPAQPPSQA